MIFYFNITLKRLLASFNEGLWKFKWNDRADQGGADHGVGGRATLVSFPVSRTFSADFYLQALRG